MIVWVLALYAAGMEPGNTQIVDNIASEAQCRTLGESMAAAQKEANHSTRYVFRCFSVEKAHS